MDVYSIVTEKIVNLLQSGVVPWRRPWTSTGLLRDLITRKPYRGINYFLLSASKYVSLLAHDAPGKRAWRLDPQNRGEHDRDLLED